MEEKLIQSKPNGKHKHDQGSGLTMTALGLAFVPSAIFLLVKDLDAFASGNGDKFWLASIISSACCFGSSFILFRRKVTWAMAVGALFLLINLWISGALGCAAILSGIR